MNKWKNQITILIEVCNHHSTIGDTDALGVLESVACLLTEAMVVLVFEPLLIHIVSAPFLVFQILIKCWFVLIKCISIYILVNRSAFVNDRICELDSGAQSFIPVFVLYVASEEVMPSFT